MDLQPFNGDDPLISTIRLVLAGVALLHALICLRVLLMRALHPGRTRTSERVPTGAMLAYGILTANIARLLLLRIPGAPPLNWLSVVIYASALAAGTWGFTHIVYLVRRQDQHMPSRRVPRTHRS